MIVYAYNGDTYLLRTCKVLAFPPLWEKLGSVALPRLPSKASGSVSPMTFQGRQLHAYFFKLNTLGQRDIIVCICTKLEKQTNKLTLLYVFVRSLKSKQTNKQRDIIACICVKLGKQTNKLMCEHESECNPICFTRTR